MSNSYPHPWERRVWIGTRPGARSALPSFSDTGPLRAWRRGTSKPWPERCHPWASRWVLVTQPYRIEGNPRVADEQSLDRAWTAIWPRVCAVGAPLVAGGRSAGSQVACRTARALGAQAVLALAYPLLGPGSPAELLATGKPTLVVQGGQDPFGRPDQFPSLLPDMELVAIPSANHMFATGRPSGGPEPVAQVTEAVIESLDRRLRLDMMQGP